jgi:signal transduction histidine kinase
VLRPMLWLALGFIAAQAYLYSAALLGRGPATRPLPVPLFIPQAVALSVLLLAPRRYWWLLLGEYGLLLTGQTLSVRGLLAWQSHLSNVGDLLEALIGALLLRRLIALPPRFEAPREVGLYAASVLAASAVSATWGAGVRLVGGGEIWPFWRAWFLSDALASLLLAPTILLWVDALANRSARLPRRRGPEAVALAVGLVVVAFVVFGTTNQGPETAPALLYLPVPLLLWAAARFGPLGIASALSLVVALAVAGVANDLGPFVDRPREANVLAVQVFLLAIGVPLFALSALVRERPQAQARPRRLRDQAWPAAEPGRIARELHDSVAQALFAAHMTADALPRVWELDPGEVRPALVELRCLTGGALAEMRALLLELRPDALVRAPLHELLETLAASTAARTSAVVEARLDPAPSLPPDVKVSLYRIAQEALTNSARHAKAQRITVSLRRGRGGADDAAATGEGLTLEVTDDGQGFEPARTSSSGLGLGLPSVRERAESIGATLRISSQPGRGATVAVTWRLPQGDRRKDSNRASRTTS